MISLYFIGVFHPQAHACGFSAKGEISPTANQLADKTQTL
jgi:hypothetical protein